MISWRGSQKSNSEFFTRVTSISATFSSSTHFPANIIFLYGWSKFHICIHPLSLSVDRHLRQFHFPANRAAMKKDVQVFLWWDTESFRYMSRNDIAVVLFIAFEKPPHCFPQLLHQFTSPSTLNKDPLSPYPLPEFVFMFPWGQPFWRLQWNGVSK